MDKQHAGRNEAGNGVVPKVEFSRQGATMTNPEVMLFVSLGEAITIYRLVVAYNAGREANGLRGHDDLEAVLRRVTADV